VFLVFNLLKSKPKIYIKFKTAKPNTSLNGWCFWFGMGISHVDLNPFKCGADEHRGEG
jgi:hypothetical protein